MTTYYIYVIVTYISCFSDFAFCFYYYFMENCYTWIIISMWQNDLHTNTSRSVWPILYGLMIKMLQYKMYPAGELRCPTTALVLLCALHRRSKSENLFFFFTGLGGSFGCAVLLETRRSRVQTPLRSATFFRGDWLWNIFYGHFLPSADSRRAVVGRSLPSKCVVR